MRKFVFKLFFSIIFIFLLISFNYSENLSLTSVREKIKKNNLSSEYWNYYFELGQLRKIPEEKLAEIINTKIDYILFIQNNIKNFQKNWMGVFLFFSDIGIAKENVIKIQYKNINYKNLKRMENFLSILKSNYNFNSKDLNKIYSNYCIKNYKLEDLNSLIINLKRNSKKLKLKSEIVKDKINGSFEKGLDVKFILREITGVINE